MKKQLYTKVVCSHCEGEYLTLKRQHELKEEKEPGRNFYCSRKCCAQHRYSDGVANSDIKQVRPSEDKLSIFCKKQ